MRFWGECLPLVVEGRFETDFAVGGRFAAFETTGSFCLRDETDRPIGRLDFDGAAPRDGRARSAS